MKSPWGQQSFLIAGVETCAEPEIEAMRMKLSGDTAHHLLEALEGAGERARASEIAALDYFQETAKHEQPVWDLYTRELLDMQQVIESRRLELKQMQEFDM